MKKILLLCFSLLIFSAALIGQTVLPQAMKYQAVARDHKGQIMGNKAIQLKISLLSGATEGRVVYAEIHDVTTSALGLFDLTIGQGAVSKGEFAQIPWSAEEIWMDIAISEDGSGDFNSISTSRLLAVPYAFHAGSADRLTGSAADSEDDIPTRAAGPYWKTNGNNQVMAPYQFLGTVDNSTLMFKTNNQERMTITGNGDISMSGPLSLESTLSVDGIAMFNNTTESTTKDNGSVIVEGGVGIEKNTNIGGELDVIGIATISNTTQSTTKDDGALVVEGGLGVEKNVNIGGELDVSGISKLNGQVTIDATLADAAAGDNYDRYPLQVQGSGQGIAINVEDIPGSNSGRSNNYISFWKGNTNMTGRIEGMSNFDLDPTGLTDLIFDDFLSLNGGNVGITIGDIADIIADGFSGNTNNFTGAADNYENVVPNQTEIDNFNSQIFSNYTLDVLLGTTEIIRSTIMFASSILSILDPEDTFSTGVDLTVEIVNMAIYVTYSYVNIGVAYESGSGDYAEWLERADYNEILNPGEVVGVIGGKISKEFNDADKFMVISTAPAVLGNMPESKELEAVHEKVAFMGQIPVKVIGEVKIGDYILPSGNADGFAMAIAPEKMKAKDFGRIIGVAWEAADGEKAFEYINTAVGINANDMAGMVDQMQSVLNKMQLAIQEVNPNYEPELFQVSGQSNMLENGYTVSPSMNQHILNQLNVDENASLDTKLGALKKYAYDNGAGEYLESFPHLFELMDNPHDEALVQEVISEYTVALQNAQYLAHLIKQNRN